MDGPEWGRPSMGDAFDHSANQPRRMLRDSNPRNHMVHPCSKRARSTGLRQASIWPLTAAGRAPNLDRRSSPYLVIRRKPKGFRGGGRTRTREAEATDLQSVPVAAWVRHRKQGEGFPLQAEHCSSFHHVPSPRWRDVGGKTMSDMPTSRRALDGIRTRVVSLED